MDTSAKNGNTLSCRFFSGWRNPAYLFQERVPFCAAALKVNQDKNKTTADLLLERSAVVIICYFLMCLPWSPNSDLFFAEKIPMLSTPIIAMTMSPAHSTKWSLSPVFGTSDLTLFSTNTSEPSSPMKILFDRSHNELPHFLFLYYAMHFYKIKRIFSHERKPKLTVKRDGAPAPSKQKVPLKATATAMTGTMPLQRYRKNRYGP